MNAAVKTIRKGALTGVGAYELAWVRRNIALLIMCVAIFVSALSVIYATNETRGYYATLQAQQNEKQMLHVEWGKLLLEQGTWVSQARVEDVAKTYLDMHVPRKKRMIIVA